MGIAEPSWVDILLSAIILGKGNIAKNNLHDIHVSL